jgi:DNA-binding GntR family transcriptional regulator
MLNRYASAGGYVRSTWSVALSDSEESFGAIGKSVAAYERLRQLTTEGLLRPRERLIPTRLATLLRVSATPVREALARLAAEGYISWRTHVGYFTKLLTVEEQRNLYEMLYILLRGSLETHIASFTMADLRELAPPSSSARTANPQVANAYVRFVEQLDDRIASLSGNRELRRTVNTLLHRTHLVRAIDFETSQKLRQVHSHLRILLDALKRHDLEKAIAALNSVLAGRIANLSELVMEANVRAMRARLP